MKTKLLLFLLISSALGFGQVIFSNPITGTNPGQTAPYTTGQVVDPNINSAVTQISRSGVTGDTGNNRYNVTTWVTNPTPNNTILPINTSKCIEFTIAPNVGYKINFTDFIYTRQLSGTSETAKLTIRSSVDGYTSDIGTPLSIASGTVPTTLDLSSATYQNITSAITFRIYIYEIGGNSPHLRTFSVANISFNGSVVSTSPSCTFTGTPLTQAGITQTFCIDNAAGSSILSNNTLTVAANSGEYVAVNVVKGYKYSFSVGNVFSGNENLTLFDDLDTSTSIGFNSSASGTSIINWTAPFSGIVRVLLSKGSCVNDGTTGGNTTITLNSIGNTHDSQTVTGTDSWVGHVYNYPGGNMPGGTSPASISTTSAPFTNANYAGYYNIGTENFDTNFNNNDDVTCFDVLSNNVIRTQIKNSSFAVRYRMNTTKSGCYLVKVSGDDGVRLYQNGTLIPLLDVWSDHGLTTYAAIINLTAGDALVLDYYENGGGNRVIFNMTPFISPTNTITAASNAVCNATPVLLTGTSFNSLSSGVNNTFFDFQWQSSPDGAAWTDIAGANSKDYTTPAITAPAGTVDTKYYRRKFVPRGTVSLCSAYPSFTNTVSVSTSDCSACTLTGASQEGAVPTTLCVDNPTVTSINLNAGKYVLQNVVQGFTYRFTVGDVFAGTEENITLFNAADDTPFGVSGSLKGYTGLTLNWTSPLSGQIKALLSIGQTCLNDGTAATGPVSFNVVSVGNTLDSQTAKGADTWIGHVYNYPGGGSPGGVPSPVTVSSTTSPFINTNYAGYYNVPSATFSAGFGGNTNCFSIFTNNVERTTIHTETFAVRYRMDNISRTGCYLINIVGADDGVRLYYDNNIVYDDWTQHGATSFNNIFVNLAANKELVLDYYENGGGNSVGISFTPFNDATNTIAPTPNVCSGSSATLNASSYLINGTVNPSLNFQWQISNDNLSWTDISGATSEDYTTVAITTTVPETRYYRRIVTPTSTPSCALTSASTIVVTSPGVPTTQTITNNSSICSTQKTFSVPSDSNVITYTWTVPSGWTVVSGQFTNTITYNTTTAGGTIGLAIINGCGTTTPPTINVLANPDTTWNGAWNNGVPDGTRRIIFAGNYTFASNLPGCSCRVNSGTISVASGFTLNLINELTVAGGSMTFENNSSLVQQNSTIANTGNITYKRNTTGVNRYDFTYWSSPVSGTQTLSQVQYTNLGVLVPPLFDKYFSYNENTDAWVELTNGTATMTNARGYLIRAPQTYSLTARTLNAQARFVGIPNNGTITIPNSTTANRYNLIGNPYPSAINADDFINANSTRLFGTLNFWTHTTNTVYNSGTQK
jgi:hypothetical protein